MSEANAEMLRSLADAMSAGDWDRARQLVADDIEFVDVAASETIKGFDDFVRFEESWGSGFSDMEIETLAVVADESLAAGDFVLRGTHAGPIPTPDGDLAATGRKIELPYAFVCEIRGGKITQIRDYYNPATANEQLGITS